MLERTTTTRIQIEDHLDSILIKTSMHKALGHLAMWSYSAYDKVLIFNLGMDLNASFTNTKTGSNYFIAGIYDKDTDTYSFHS